MRVRDILQYKRTALLTLAPDSPLSLCAATMADEDVGSAIVVDGNRLVGLVTFREVNGVVARSEDGAAPGTGPRMQDLRVDDVMVRDPFVVGMDAELEDLRGRMLRRRQRYVPVMDGDVLAGVLSFHDVARAAHESHGSGPGVPEPGSAAWPDTAAAGLARETR